MEVFTYKDYLRYKEIYTVNAIKEESEEYVYETNNTHDKLMKTILTKSEISKLLKRYINIEVSEEDLEEYKNSYITKNYKERESDIVYKQKGKEVFFLIEHQSSIDYNMPFRILEYSVEIIRQEIKNNKKTKELKYPQIVPIVIYTGNKKWDVKENLSLMQEEIEGDSAELFKYNLIDINKYTKEELLEENTMFSKIAVLEKSKTSQEMLEALKEIVKQTKDEKEELYRIINYIIRPKIGDNETEKILKMIKEKEDNSMVQEIFARECDKHFERGLNKGIKEGRKEGIKEGIKESIKQSVIKMLKMNMDRKTIKDIYELDDIGLYNIEEEANKYSKN